MQTREFLLEIGCEEIPSNYLRGIHAAFEGAVRGRLTDLGLVAEGAAMRSFCGPRRLVFHAAAVALAQEDKVLEVLGPSTRAAFDADGAPTRAAEGFARGQGGTVADLYRVAGPKGEVVAIKKQVIGRKAADLLAEAVPELIRGLPMPKAMRWGAECFPFIRPVHWILALLGDQVIPVEIAGVKAGRHTRGHRFRGNAPLPVLDFSDYSKKVQEAAEVAFDHHLRAQGIAEGLTALLARLDAQEPGRHFVHDGGDGDVFLMQVADLTESPRLALGSFDAAFLEVPAEILETAMKHHQRYFPIWVQGADGGERLTNRFAVVTNLPPSAPESTVATVVAGNERVLKARLSDAAFFFREDRKHRLEHYVEGLKGRIFLQGLGTVYDKAQRLQALADRTFAELIVRVAEGPLATPSQVATVEAFASANPNACVRAALLAKADLGTHVVGEFPEVQGVMGRYYAGFDGEPGDVPAAIAEHYLPRFQGDAIPRTLAGTVVALADKLDSIVGAFALGLEPSGSQDPYALRRQAIGVIRILTQDDPTPAFTPFDLEARRLIEAAADTFGPGVVKDHAALADKVADFLTGRFRVMLAEQGRDANLIAAVLGTASTGFTDLGLRLKALEAISGSPDFAPMLIAFKRVMNISKDHAATEYSAAAFAHQTERDLAAAFEAMAGRFDAAMQARAYDAALNEIVGLKPAIDRFFDDVLVMDPDPAVRANRLGLVRAIADRFRRFADFARVQG